MQDTHGGDDDKPTIGAKACALPLRQTNLTDALRSGRLGGDAPPSASAQSVAWSQDWLQQVYVQCASLPTCRNEFGTAWRFHVPEPRRSDKRVGVCLCRMYPGETR